MSTADASTVPSAVVSPVVAVSPGAASRRRGRVSTILGLFVLAVFVLAALISVVWTPHDPLAVHPHMAFAGSSGRYWLGTDQYGRDTLSRLMSGSRITAYSAICSVLIAAAVGVPAGLIAAQGGGLVSELIMRVADIVFAFPALLAAITLTAALGASTSVALVAIGVAFIPVFARVTRGAALTVLKSEYVLAARSYGRRPSRILISYVLPNIGATVIAQATLLLSLAVLAQASLQYLGLGTPPPAASWGGMLADGQRYLSEDTLMVVVPAVAVCLTILALNTVGNAVQDWLDPRRKGRE